MKVERIGVVGAGTMGAGIAQIACLGGYETRLHDPVGEALEKGLQRLPDALAKGVARGLWSEEEATEARGRISPARGLAELSGCDLVIEAAPEDLGLKQQLFAQLAAACGPETILATNTSSLPVTAIAADTPQPERVVGMHFFNPPALMKLVEVVFTERSSRTALDATTEVGSRMGRTPVRARDRPGFVANRLARPFSLESLRMLEQGIADAPAIDRICRLGGGFRMGPFELLDLIGLDVNLAVARSLYEQAGKPARWRPSERQEQLVAEGHLGRKTERGFHEYPSGKHRHDGPKEKARDLEPSVDAPTLDSTELERIDPAAPEVLPRLIAQIANEAAFALEEEIAAPADLDTAMRLGFNWPLGPVELSGLIGAERAVALLEELAERHGDAYRPAPKLASLASQ